MEIIGYFVCLDNLTIYGQTLVLIGNGIAGYTDHPLDVVERGIFRIAKNHHITALRVVDADDLYPGRGFPQGVDAVAGDWMGKADVQEIAAFLDQQFRLAGHEFHRSVGRSGQVEVGVADHLRQGPVHRQGIVDVLGLRGLDLLDLGVLVDGGPANNMPVSLARAMGADVVIAIDIGTPMSKRDKMTNLLGISMQMSTMLARETADEERRAGRLRRRRR